MERASTNPVVLFDGVCNLCNRGVNFLIDRDPRRRLTFAALQSPEGQRLLAEHGVPRDLDSVVLVEEGRAYTRSAAALRLARKLPWPWPLLAVLVVIPRPLRDALYDALARRRYRWFGHRDACRVPTPELRSRFL